MSEHAAIFRFLDWDVYRAAKELIPHVLEIVRGLPREYRFELGNQIVRSSSFIALNIAEGSGKRTDRELARFITISLGSAHETFAALDILQDNGLADVSAVTTCQRQLMSIVKQLGGFKSAFLKKSRSQVISH